MISDNFENKTLEDVGGETENSDNAIMDKNNLTNNFVPDKLVEDSTSETHLTKFGDQSNEDSKKSGPNFNKIIWPIILILLIGSFSYAYFKPKTLTDAQRAANLESQIKCPACEGQSVANSTAAIAVSIKAKVYQDILNRQSDNQILNSLANTYGQAIYLSPHGSSAADLSWIIPLLIIFFILFGLSLTFINRQTRFITKFKLKIQNQPTHRSKLNRFRKTFLYSGITLILLGILYFLGLGFGLNLPGKAQSQKAQFTNSQLLTIANFEASTGDDAQAVSTYKQILTNDPKNVEALSQEGWIISQNGQFNHNNSLVALGEALILKAMSYNPNYAIAHLYLGTIYLTDLNNSASAAAQYSKFLSLNPPKNLIETSKPEMILAFKNSSLPIPNILG